MTQARWQDRAGATSVSVSRWLGLAFGFGCWGTGCEVVGEIGADDLVASTSTSTSTADDSSSDRGTTEDATKPTTTTTTSSSSTSDESSSGDDEPDTAAFDVGNGGSDTSSSETTYTDESTTLPEDVESTSSGTAGGGAPPCCEAAMEPGCIDPELEACVCAADDFCCAEQWDDACVDVAVFGDCGAVCDDMPIAPEQDDCCVVNDAAAGCVDPVVQDCVCATDPYCCAYAWDAVCVDYVEQLDCGVCE